MWNIRQLSNTAVMKYKLQNFVSMYWIVYVTFMQVLVVVVALMNQKCTEEWQGLYYTDGIIRMHTDICCDALSTCHHHTEKLRLPSETSLPHYYSVSCWFGTVC